MHERGIRHAGADRARADSRAARDLREHRRVVRGERYVALRSQRCISVDVRLRVARHRVDRSRQRDREPAGADIGGNRKHRFVGLRVDDDVVRVHHSAVCDVGEGVLADDADVDTSADAARAAVLDGAGDRQEFRGVGRAHQHIMLAGVGADERAVDLRVAADPGLGVLVEHVDRDRTADAERLAATEPGGDREDVLRGRCSDRDAVRAFGRAVAVGILRPGLHLRLRPLASRRDLRVVADVGLNIVDVNNRGHRQAERGRARRDTGIAGDGMDVRILQRLHDHVAVGVHRGAIADERMGMVVAHEHRDRAADGGVLARAYVRGNGELVLGRPRFHGHVAARLDISGIADRGLGVLQEHLHVDPGAEAR